MLLSLGVVAIAVLIAGVEAPSLIKKRAKRELIVFSALLIFATVISILHVLNIPLPSPHDWISYLYKPLSDVINRALQ